MVNILRVVDHAGGTANRSLGAVGEDLAVEMNR